MDREQVLSSLKRKLESGVSSTLLLTRMRGKKFLPADIVGMVEGVAKIQTIARSMLSISDAVEELREETIELIYKYMGAMNQLREQIVVRIDEYLAMGEVEQDSSVLPEGGENDGDRSPHLSQQDEGKPGSPES